MDLSRSLTAMVMTWMLGFMGYGSGWGCAIRDRFRTTSTRIRRIRSEYGSVPFYSHHWMCFGVPLKQPTVYGYACVAW